MGHLGRRTVTIDSSDVDFHQRRSADELEQQYEEECELVMFLRERRKWYLVPIILVILAMGLLIILAGTGAAPFIYTLF